jgi:hypothetical protein
MRPRNNVVRLHHANTSASSPQMHPPHQTSAHAPLDEQFKQMDGDGDGMLSVDEAEEAGFSNKQFEHMDANGDGEISKEEFISSKSSGAIQGILIYLVFISVYISSTANHFGHNIFFFANSLKGQFTGVEMLEHFSPSFDKDFGDVATVEEYYHWLQSGFFHSAFNPNTFDSSDRRAGMEAGYTLGSNKIVGAIRISQARSERRVCSDIPDELSIDEQYHCWEGGEPQGNFGNFTWNGASTQFERSGIKVNPAYELLPAMSVSKERSIMYSGYFGKVLEIAYEAPAWSVLLDPTAPTSVNQAAVLALINGKYVDLQTTAVFVDLTVYNPNLDYMCVVKLVAELPPGGGVYTSSEFHVIRVYNRFTDEDKQRYALDIVVGIFYAYYFIQGCILLRKTGMKYFCNPSNWLIFVNVILYGSGRYYEAQMLRLAPSNVDVEGSEFYNYWPSAQCARLVIQLASANCFINIFQGVEHLSYVPTFALLSDTIKTAGPDLLSFGFVFILVFYGFAQAHTMVFRDRVEGYRSLKHASYSLMSALLGDFNFNELYAADRALGPFYFDYVHGIAVFVELNMIIAIISDAYSVCSAKMKLKPKLNLTREIYAYTTAQIESLPFGVGRRFREVRLRTDREIAHRAEQMALKMEEMADGVAAVGVAAAGVQRVGPMANILKVPSGSTAAAPETRMVKSSPGTGSGRKWQMGKGNRKRQVVPVDHDDVDHGNSAGGESEKDAALTPLDREKNELLPLQPPSLPGSGSSDGGAELVLRSCSPSLDHPDDGEIIAAMERTIQLQQEQLRASQQMVDQQMKYIALLKKKGGDGAAFTPADVPRPNSSGKSVRLDPLPAK